MPVTISYDLTQVGNNDHTYLRSMFERFNWRRIGGSVFRYSGVEVNGSAYEDWLNHVAPALMFMRSFVIRRGISLKAFTIDASSVSFLDHSDATALLGTAPMNGTNVPLVNPTNTQCPEQTARAFVDAAISAVPVATGQGPTAA